MNVNLLKGILLYFSTV